MGSPASSATTTNVTLRAGVARREITTEDPAMTVLDPLYSKALVLSDGKTALVLITMDVTAIGGRTVSDNMLPDVADDFLPKLRARIEKELNIPGHHVMVNASHTHPIGRMLVDDDQQIIRTFDAVKEALGALAPATVGSTIGTEDRLTMNRTLRLKNGKHWTVRYSNPCPPDADVESVGPHDPSIGIIRIDRVDGTPLALLYNFATHLLFAHPKGAVTADYTGVASNVIESTLGHGATAFFIQGAAGDVIDIYFKELSRPRDIDAMGTRLAVSTLQAARDISTAPASIQVVSETVQLPFRGDIPQRIATLEKELAEYVDSLRGTTLNFKTFLPMYLQRTIDAKYPSDYSFRYLQEKALGRDDHPLMDEFTGKLIDKYLANLAAMEKIARHAENIDTLKKHQRLIDDTGSPTVAAEIQAFRIGDCILIAAPIEILTEVGLNVKAASPCKKTFVAGFTNGYLHYGSPTHHYEKGGYEVNECLLGPGWQEIYESTCKRLISQLQ